MPVLVFSNPCIASQVKKLYRCLERNIPLCQTSSFQCYEISVFLFLRLHMNERRATSRQRVEFTVVRNLALVSTEQPLMAGVHR